MTNYDYLFVCYNHQYISFDEMSIYVYFIRLFVFFLLKYLSSLYIISQHKSC